MDADRRAAEIDANLAQIKREGNAFNSGLGVGRAMGPDETIDLRMRCLAQANETAKLGLSRDVYETAERYYRWAIGEQPEVKVELPYKTALIAMMEAEILGERTDLEKLREETAECFGIVEDRHWPKKTAKEMAEEAHHWPNLPLRPEDVRLAVGEPQPDRHFVVQKPDGTIADRADFERLERELDEISDRIVQPITDSLRRRYEAEAQARAVATGGAEPAATTRIEF